MKKNIFLSFHISMLFATFCYGQSKEIIFKLKPEYFQNKEIYIKKIKNNSLGVNIVSVEPFFKNSTNDFNKKDKNGFPLVNLSAIFKVKYTSRYSKDEVIKYLQKLPYFDYVSIGFESIKVKPLSFQPNDPFADTLNFKSKITGLDSAGGAWQLDRINAYKAWEIHKGDSNTVLAIVDWGFNYEHEDLFNSLKRNFNDPIDGIDNDNNGYVDDFLGWDFGMNDNNPKNTCLNHGTQVASVAAATPNNGKGIAGSGYNCRFMALKIAKDADCSVPDVLNPIVYAADNGAKVINLSFDIGGNYPIFQDLINYAVINKDVAVVAAAGQYSDFRDVFPASHDNVLSVAMSDFYDCKGTDATYSYHVDLMSPGKYIYGVMGSANNTYGQLDGSSYSSPIVAGALTLLRSKYPQLTAQQSMELLRVTAKNVENINTICGVYDASKYRDKLGKGVLDMHKALSDTISPAVRYVNYRLANAENGMTNLFLTLRNFLRTTNNLKITIRSLNSLIGISDSMATYGVLGTMEIKENTTDEFRMIISSLAGQDFEALLRIGFTDIVTNYTDYQYIKIKINPSFLNINANKLQLSVTSNGRLGTTDFSKNIGLGLYYLNTPFNPQILESGLMVGLNSSVVSNCIINAAATNNDNHFKSIANANYKSVIFADQYIESQYNDSLASNPIGVHITQKTYAYRNTPNEKYIIIEYTLKNQTSNVIDSLSVGIFNQWNIGDQVAKNMANWDCETRTGYAYDGVRKNVFVGVSLLSSQPSSYFAMNNSSGILGNIDITNGFSSAEKWQSLTRNRLFANSISGNNSSNVSNVTSAKIYNLQPNQSQKVAFAFVAGDNFLQLQSSSKSAKAKYVSLYAGPIPNLDTIFVCNSDVANNTIVKPINGSNYKFYTSLPGCNILPIHTGTALTLNGVNLPYQLYVTNIDSSAESIAKLIIIKKTIQMVNFTVAGSLIAGDSAQFFSESFSANSKLQWHFDSMNNTTLPNPFFVFSTSGSYLITLTSTNLHNCTAQNIQTISIVGTYLTLNSDSLVYDSLGGIQYLVINSNTKWQFQKLPNWLNFNSKNGRGNATITGTVVEKNPWGFDRDTTLQIGNRTLQVKQKGQKPYLKVSPKYLDLIENNFSLNVGLNDFDTLFVQSNIKWFVILDTNIIARPSISGVLVTENYCGQSYSYVKKSAPKGSITLSKYSGEQSDFVISETTSNANNLTITFVGLSLLQKVAYLQLYSTLLFPCSVSKFEEFPFKILPNPVNDFLQINSNIDFEPDTELSITNNLGQKQNLIYSFSLAEITVNVSNLPPGMYMLHIKIGEKLWRKKIVVNR